MTFLGRVESTIRFLGASSTYDAGDASTVLDPITPRVMSTSSSSAWLGRVEGTVRLAAFENSAHNAGDAITPSDRMAPRPMSTSSSSARLGRVEGTNRFLSESSTYIAGDASTLSDPMAPRLMSTLSGSVNLSPGVMQTTTSTLSGRQMLSPGVISSTTSTLSGGARLSPGVIPSTTTRPNSICTATTTTATEQVFSSRKCYSHVHSSPRSSYSERVLGASSTYSSNGYANTVPDALEPDFDFLQSGCRRSLGNAVLSSGVMPGATNATELFSSPSSRSFLSEPLERVNCDRSSNPPHPSVGALVSPRSMYRRAHLSGAALVSPRSMYRRTNSTEGVSCPLTNSVHYYTAESLNPSDFSIAPVSGPTASRVISSGPAWVDMSDCCVDGLFFPDGLLSFRPSTGQVSQRMAAESTFCHISEEFSQPSPTLENKGASGESYVASLYMQLPPVDRRSWINAPIEQEVAFSDSTVSTRSTYVSTGDFGVQMHSSEGGSRKSVEIDTHIEALARKLQEETSPVYEHPFAENLMRQIKEKKIIVTTAMSKTTADSDEDAMMAMAAEMETIADSDEEEDHIAARPRRQFSFSDLELAARQAVKEWDADTAEFENRNAQAFESRESRLAMAAGFIRQYKMAAGIFDNGASPGDAELVVNGQVSKEKLSPEMLTSTLAQQTFAQREQEVKSLQDGVGELQSEIQRMSLQLQENDELVADAGAELTGDVVVGDAVISKIDWGQIRQGLVGIVKRVSEASDSLVCISFPAVDELVALHPSEFVKVKELLL